MEGVEQDKIGQDRTGQPDNQTAKHPVNQSSSHEGYHLLGRQVRRVFASQVSPSVSAKISTHVRGFGVGPCPFRFRFGQGLQGQGLGEGLGAHLHGPLLVRIADGLICIWDICFMKEEGMGKGSGVRGQATTPDGG